MKRFLPLVLWVTVGILSLGLTAAGSATAKSAPSVGTHRAMAHVINLHKAYEARLGHSTLSKIAGIFYGEGHVPGSRGRGGTSCSEPYCPVYYHGGLVQQNPHVYLLLWGPNWSSDPSQAATASYLENFYKGLGWPGDNWSAITSQYGDSTGFPKFGDGVFMGAYNDTNTPPAGTTPAQFAAEADAFTATQGITDLNDAQIVVATQSGTCPKNFIAPSCPTKDRGVYCAWHDSSNEPFTNLPYLLDAAGKCGEDSVNHSNGTYDGFSIVGGHEYAESITDPYPDTGWWDPNDLGGGEIADKCAWSLQSSDIALQTGSFAMQPLWSNSANGCVMSRVRKGDITVDDPGNQSDYQYVKQVSLQMIGTSSKGYQLNWVASQLPAGLTIDPSTGMISGQVTAAPGTYSVTVSASDPITTLVSVNFTWTVTADVGSTVTNEASGLCLNDYKWLTTPGNEVVLWHCGPSANEEFSQTANPGELVVFGQCLTDTRSLGAGQIQQIYPCTGAKDQEWYYNSSDEYVMQQNNLCLTDPAGAVQNGTPSVIETCTGASDQQWLGS